MAESLRSKPSFTLEEAREIATKHFRQSGTIHELPSERDQNFLIETLSGTDWVLKCSNSDTPLQSIQLQQDIAQHLNTQFEDYVFPAADASAETVLPQIQNPKTGQSHYCRLVPFHKGVTWATYRPIGNVHWKQLGQLLGRMTRELQSFQHPGAHRPLQWDLAHCSKTIRQGLDLIPSSEDRDEVNQALDDYEKHVQATHQNARQSVIHGDANDHNLILSDATAPERSKLSLIDFGDTVYSATINELAIALAYALFDVSDPLRAASVIVSAFHQEFPVQEEELAMLPSLISMRLCTTLSQNAIALSIAPDDPYLSVSVQPAREQLRHLNRLPANLLTYALRKACGLPAHPNSGHVKGWIQSQPAMHPIIDCPLDTDRIAFLDLGVGSPMAFSGESPQAIDRATRKIADQLFESGASIGIGQYNEARFCYQAPQYRTSEGHHRSVHLGIDLFLEPGLPVKAPFAGTVHSCRDNDGVQDYGPTVILEHQTNQPNVRFFTLFGHLGRESISHLSPGKSIQAGETIGCIGSPFENGGWPPHLHWQLMVDRLGYSGDFPGAAAPQHRDLWLDLCPDPSPLLGIKPPDRATSKQRADALATRRAKTVGPSLSLSYREPLHFVQGQRQFLYDTEGQPYLDGVNNVCHVGHSHPHVVQKIADQAALLNTNTRYLHEHLTEYTEKLLNLFPRPLEVCFLVCSGSEANDLALRLSRHFTGSKETIVLGGAYHGNLSSLIEISPYKFAGPGGFQAPHYVHPMGTPDPYRGPFRRPSASMAQDYALEVEQTVEKIRAHGKGPPTFIAESILSCAGQIVLPEDYLAQCYASVRNAGGLCIADEVQVGFGRVGTHTWGFETQGVVPDIVTLGKPIGNGHPIGAVVTTREIGDRFHNGMEYFNTFGGNPVSCIAGLSVLEVMREEDLQTHAKLVGTQLREGLKALQTRFPFMGDVRGHGLFLGIEFVADPNTRTPAPLVAKYIVERMKDHRILLSTDGPQHNVIKIKPPLPFSSDDGKRLQQTLESILQENPIEALLKQDLAGDHQP